MMTAAFDHYLSRNPTTQEVIDNTRPAAFDACVSAWQAQSYGLSLLLIADARPDGAVRWHLWVPFEAPDDAKGYVPPRFVEVHPPEDTSINRWSFRPLDPESWTPVSWESIEKNAPRGRDRHAQNLRDHAALVRRQSAQASP